MAAKISRLFLDRRHSCWHGFRTHTLNRCFKQLKWLMQIINITVCTVVQDCCKGRSNKYGKRQFWA